MEGQDGGAAPTWLFSFVDLAFLMLIAMTQMAGDAAQAPDLGEMVVPRIGAEQAPGELAADASRSWQLRVHPPEPGRPGEPPFELVASDAAQIESASGSRISRDALAAQLAKLSAERTDKPLLAPHEDSRSQDFLDAAGLLEDHWPSRRRALVARLTEP